ncbi:MAG: hypothetical protein JSW25_08290 [Thermoplasmata archaeon]|nr:MAG: hypothetical protein JSW25_08290 [Thermoplasmata archaeon]
MKDASVFWVPEDSVSVTSEDPPVKVVMVSAMVPWFTVEEASIRRTTATTKRDLAAMRAGFM